METNAKYFFVGLSLLALCIVGALGISWLLGAGKDKNQEFFTVNFRQSSVSGITPGSNVTMRGLRVGSVQSIEFIKNDIEGVRVVLAMQDGTPVKTDTQAVVQRNLVTGQAVIDLIKTSKSAPLLQTTTGGDEYPVITEGQGEVEAIKNRVPEILDHTNELLARMEVIFSPENSAQGSELLGNLNQISKELTKDGNKPSEVLAEVKKTIGEVKDLAVQLKGTLIPLVSGIANRAESVTNNVNGATTNIAAAAQSLENPRSIVTGPASGDVGPGEQAQ